MGGEGREGEQKEGPALPPFQKSPRGPMERRLTEALCIEFAADGTDACLARLALLQTTIEFLL